MQMLTFTAILAITITMFLLFDVKTSHFIGILEEMEKNKTKSFKNLIRDRENPILLFFKTTNSMLTATRQKGKLTLVILSTAVLIAFGAFVAIFINNVYLVPVFAIVFGSIPFIFIRFQFIKYNKVVMEELTIAMASVTSSYERTENILLSFKENLDDTAEPIKSVFAGFINEIENVNPNYELAIEHMKNKVKNNVWVEWCEALKRCVHNKNIKHVLSPIVTKLSKINITTDELKTILSEVVKDFYILVGAALVLLYVGVYLLPSGLMIDIPVNLSNIMIAVNILTAYLLCLRVTIIASDIKFDV